MNKINALYNIYYFSGEWHAGENLMIFTVLVIWTEPRFQHLKEQIPKKVSIKLLLMEGLFKCKSWILNISLKFNILHTTI